MGLATVAAIKALCAPSSGKHHPENFFKASGECLFLLFVVTWAITFGVNPHIPTDNALLTLLGYNNLCVGFDTSPSNIVGGVMFIPSAYFNVRFAVEDIKRTNLVAARLSKNVFRFCIFGNTLLVLATAWFSTVFIAGPFHGGHWIHTLPFLFYIVARAVCVLAHKIKSEDAWPTKSKVWLFVYLSVSALFPLMVIIDFAYYDKYGTGPGVPWPLTFTLDYIWFLCLPLTSVLMPKGELLYTQLSVAPPDVVKIQGQVQPEDGLEVEMTHDLNIHS